MILDRLCGDIHRLICACVLAMNLECKTDVLVTTPRVLHIIMWLITQLQYSLLINFVIKVSVITDSEDNEWIQAFKKEGNFDLTI